MDLSVLHLPDGPVNWIAMQLLTMGMRSPRILIHTTVHLVHALRCTPACIQHYLEHLSMIILHEAKHRGCPDTETKAQKYFPVSLLNNLQ